MLFLACNSFFFCFFLQRNPVENFFRKAGFPLGEFFRAKWIFLSTDMRSLISTDDTVFAGSFLFSRRKIKFEQFLLFRRRPEFAFYLDYFLFLISLRIFNA